ncbi:hypothetical protein WBG78_15025 [Chryseolinea sp. T2]|uniref:hypothetical protein n=1 Tax=Chryseolinea sp. T2 TaxID=3129255 RepID=UPI003076B6CF
MQRNQSGVLAICSLLLAVAACQEETTYGGFTTTSSSALEGSGSQTITIDLGATATTSTLITYRVGGNAAMDGDYHLTTATSYYSDAPTVTVPPGESTATITFDIIDDQQIEQEDEVIYFEITAISDASIAGNFRQGSFVFQILDNDEPKGSDLQIDLAWNLGDGVRINASNFNLYLATGVTVDASGSVTEFQAVDGKTSANETGFESVVIDNNLPDQKYYVIIDYISGDDPATLTLQFNSDQVKKSASGRVSSASIGKLLYLGPITKSGSNFSFQ